MATVAYRPALRAVIEFTLRDVDSVQRNFSDGQRKLYEKKVSGNLPSSEPFVGRSPERRPTMVTKKQDFKLPLLVDSEKVMRR